LCVDLANDQGLTRAREASVWDGSIAGSVAFSYCLRACANHSSQSAELWRRIEARNSEPLWNSYPIRRADLDGWLLLFQAPDAAELALFDPPPGSN
jgi:hypothetical protein